MLRPIDTLSELVGMTGLTRAKRLTDEANKIEAQTEGFSGEALDRRHHAVLMLEIHRLSNPEYKMGQAT